MKCPKCGYLGYERVERCRNCGYEFSLTPTPSPADLRLRDASTVPAPLDDLALLDTLSGEQPRPSFDAEAEGDAHAAEPNGLTELPLFGPPITDDVPLITKPSRPRPPLAVRRATPEVPRVRSDMRTPLLEWPGESTAPTPVPGVAPTPSPAPSRAPYRSTRDKALPAAEPAAPHGSPHAASVSARAAAILIDLAVLAAIDLVVIYFTMKICGIAWHEWTLLPRAPLVAFLAVQNGGYLVAFTAAGQTLGKLLAGIRVVAVEGDHAPDLGRAALRTLLWCVLALPAGLGLLSVVLGRDGRGLHDRFAGTRVIQSGA